jgi:hypothetical protein
MRSTLRSLATPFLLYVVSMDALKKRSFLLCIGQIIRYNDLVFKRGYINARFNDQQLYQDRPTGLAHLSFHFSLAKVLAGIPKYGSPELLELFTRTMPFKLDVLRRSTKTVSIADPVKCVSCFNGNFGKRTRMETGEIAP